MWARHVRKHGEQAADGEADPGLGAPAGSGSGLAAGDQTGDVAPRAREEGEVLFGDDSDEDDRQSHPAFSEDERMDPEGRVGAVQAPVRSEGPSGGICTGHGPGPPEEWNEFLTERLCRVDLCEIFFSAEGWSSGCKVRV